ncbi:PP2C family protein-serine/threonine phosphatase [Georgenia satyanarayanai]|uniref:PP2C family protein-serine/threonine phosphatase n=1 Tax=Georgenia satyanarayanai TaxID=860221 RepID=UPI00126569A5|nr:PP2C family protein-serine/threonine phosphatase [Georgenia satyanarayanai]
MATLSAARQRDRTRQAQTRAALSTDELWLRYFSLGGTAGPLELDAYLNGALELPGAQRDRVALAVNEHLDALGRVRAPLSRPLRVAGPPSGHLAALTELLRATHEGAPDELPAAVDRAAAHLGVTCVVHLADYAKETLAPMPGPSGRGGPTLGIGSTLAGRAYQLVTTQHGAGTDGRARLWVPIIDGADRLGVLEVVPDSPDDVHDPALRRECWTLAHYVGYLLTAGSECGDAVDAVRRTSPRTVEADLVWTMLPPLTARTGKVLVSGHIEPSDDMGGDVFDYALSSRSASFAILDATGHDLRASLAAATALAAYRNARRQGRGLFAQADHVHRTISEHFTEQTMYTTGVLGELDLDTGRLRYLAAGHPHPLLLRDGKVVRSLVAGRRPMLGLDLRDSSLGEEQLERGDTIVLYTDGITEGRDANRQQFGVERLVDHVERAAADRLPLPETVRRLFAAILRHQQGRLQDDATLLLLQWGAPTVYDPAP